MIWYVLDLGNDVVSHLMFREYVNNLGKEYGPCFASMRRSSYIRVFLKIDDFPEFTINHDNDFRPRFLRWNKIEITEENDISPEKLNENWLWLCEIGEVIKTSSGINHEDCVVVLKKFCDGDFSILCK